MKIIKHNLILALPDNININQFIEQFEAYLGEFSTPVVCSMSSLFNQEVREINCSDPTNPEENDIWMKKAMEEIEKEYDADDDLGTEMFPL